MNDRQPVTVTLTPAQADLVAKLLANEAIKARRLVDKANESIAYCDLSGKYTGFAEMRQQKHEQTERLVREALAVLSYARTTP